ncbi:5-formyltetrahydrofolate cyclo-ligase [Galactobacter valiniphilus]|uniref:5-formyltetrahydrofolate cyclo-ligase n=1 Tax=Galactobacter valiniphilus TaxID=2676122 RepID=UPI003736D243
MQPTPESPAPQHVPGGATGASPLPDGAARPGASAASGGGSEPGAAKAALRSALRARRRAVEPGQREAERRGWAASAGQLAAWALAAAPPGRPACLAAYLPAVSEPDPTAAMAQWHAAGLSVLVPLSLPGRRLAWVRWTPELRVSRGAHAPVPEPVGGEPADPADIDLVVVPALAVGTDGTRLGQGGGFYDSFLAGRATPTVACVRSDEVLDLVPAEAWDARLDAAWTPEGLRRLSAV